MDDPQTLALEIFDAALESAENQGGWINPICHAPTVRKARQHAGIAIRPECPACGSQARLSGLIAARSRM
jgi:hypothetical protein